MTLVANCLTRLVKNGQVSQAAADGALALYEGAQGKLGRDLPPADADAAAALETAKIMKEAARQKKLAMAKTAIALRRVNDRMESHSKGPVAGAMSMLVRDIHDEGGINVDAHSEVVFGRLLRTAGKFVDSFKSRAAGLAPQPHVSIRNAVLEMRGKDTGDPVAKEAAGAMSAAVEEGFTRLQKAGVPVTRLDDWMTPQFWESARVAKTGRDEFVRDMMDELEAGRLEVIDNKAFAAADKGTALKIINRAFDDITVGKMSSGQAAGLRNYTRIFRFQDADTYARLMDKYGIGDRGYYATMMGYLNSVSREIAMAEVLGPNHGAIAKHMVQQAKQFEVQDRPKFSKKSLNPRNLVESSGAIDRTYRYLAGETNAVESELIAGGFGSLRSINTGAKLGSAAVTAVPGDLTTSMFAAANVGLSPMRIMTGMARDVSKGRRAKAAATRLNVIAHSVMDHSIGSKRFEDEIAGPDKAARLASIVIRASGLAAWTDMAKRVFTMEMLGLVADQSARKWDAINPKFQRFLKSHGFTPAEWDQLRAAPHAQIEGAKFFDPDAIDDSALADRLLGAIIDERHFAVVEPDARVRQLTTGGQKRGNLWGEVARSSFMFKSFAMSIMLTHVKRAVSQGPLAQRAWRFTSFMAAMTLAGGVALQLRSALKGQDVRDPTDPTFAMESFFYGGGSGIYGDLLHQSTSRGGVTGAALLGGPAVELASDVIGGPFETFRRWNNGQDQNWGKRTANFLSRYLPGSTLWYSRLAQDRLFFDQIQAMLDPDYVDSFAREAERLHKRSGQGFFWAPGETSPQRAPQLAPPRP